MKKKTNWLSALLMSLLLILTLGISAMAAADSTYTITINPGANDDSTLTRTYEAYQIFKADIYGTGESAVLANIDWGTGVNGAELLSFLKTTAPYDTVFGSATTAADVANLLAEGKWTSAPLSKTMGDFAELVSKSYLTSTKVSGGSPLTVTGSGYYLVKDVTDLSDKQAANSAYIMKVVDDVTVQGKENVPTLDKKIVEGAGTVEANTASIGDKINYVITSVVPDMTGYKTYKFEIDDTMDEGLTFNNDIEVKIDGTSVDFDQKENGNGFKLAIKNMISYADKAGKEITVTYSATLNEKAKLGVTGNPNTAQLIFSNNPNLDSSDGDWPDDRGTDPVGKTPEKKTVTYTTKILIRKVDGTDKNTKLAGARFQLSGEAANVVLVNGEIYKDTTPSGDYFMLKNGTFTTTEPADSNDYYAGKKFTKVENVTKDTEKTNLIMEAYTNADGELAFAGLNAGKYSLKETEAPYGYNAKVGDETVTISAVPTITTCTWTVSSSAEVLSDGTIVISLENNKGIRIPETGGIGTVIFYLVGACMIVLAVTLIITKRRVRNKEI